MPLSTIAHFQLDNTPLSVNHQGQFPCVTISFNTAQGVSLSEATQIVERVNVISECHQAFAEISPALRRLLKLRG